MKSYREKLQDVRWQKKSAKIKERDGWKCQLGYNHTGYLSAHHKYYISGKDPWDYPDDALITICQECHDKLRYSSDNNSGCKCHKWKVPILKKIRTLSRMIKKVLDGEYGENTKEALTSISDNLDGILENFDSIKNKN